MTSMRQEQKKAKLLAAAAEAFLETGYEGTNLDAVIARAGGSKQTLYRYFGNKRGLLAALVEELASRATRETELDQAITTDYPKVLEAFLLSHLKAITSPEGLALYRLTLEQSQKDTEIAELFLKQGPLHSIHTLATYLERVMADGHLPHGDAETLADSLIAMARGSLHLRALFCKDFHVAEASLKNQARSQLQLFLNGVQRTGED